MDLPKSLWTFRTCSQPGGSCRPFCGEPEFRCRIRTNAPVWRKVVSFCPRLYPHKKLYNNILKKKKKKLSVCGCVFVSFGWVGCGLFVWLFACIHTTWHAFCVAKRKEPHLRHCLLNAKPSASSTLAALQRMKRSVRRNENDRALKADSILYTYTW